MRHISISEADYNPKEVLEKALELLKPFQGNDIILEPIIVNGHIIIASEPNGETFEMYGGAQDAILSVTPIKGVTTYFKLGRYQSSYDEPNIDYSDLQQVNKKIIESTEYESV